tara:strand:+ start:13363 stop:13584 length:222 start_codon:yes stop_codon:yes gene_type:complete
MEWGLVLYVCWFLPDMSEEFCVMWHYPYNIPAQPSFQSCLDYGRDIFTEFKKEYTHAYQAGLICDPIMEEKSK